MSSWRMNMTKWSRRFKMRRRKQRRLRRIIVRRILSLRRLFIPSRRKKSSWKRRRVNSLSILTTSSKNMRRLSLGWTIWRRRWRSVNRRLMISNKAIRHIRNRSRSSKQRSMNWRSNLSSCCRRIKNWRQSKRHHSSHGRLYKIN